jgi:hypothetical protein
MKTLDRIIAVLIVLFGATHAALAPVFRGHYDGAGMWFLSGGLMIIFLGLMNLVRAGSPAAAPRWAALAANVMGLAFTAGLVPLVPLRQSPQIVVFLVLTAAATLFSLLRRPAPTA